MRMSGTSVYVHALCINFFGFKWQSPSQGPAQAQRLLVQYITELAKHILARLVHRTLDSSLQQNDKESSIWQSLQSFTPKISNLLGKLQDFSLFGVLIFASRFPMARSLPDVSCKNFLTLLTKPAASASANAVLARLVLVKLSNSSFKSFPTCFASGLRLKWRRVSLQEGQDFSTARRKRSLSSSTKTFLPCATKRNCQLFQALFPLASFPSLIQTLPRILHCSSCATRRIARCRVLQLQLLEGLALLGDCPFRTLLPCFCQRIHGDDEI